MKVLVFVLNHESLVSNIGLGLGLEEKVLQFFKNFVVILDGSTIFFDIEYLRNDTR